MTNDKRFADCSAQFKADVTFYLDDWCKSLIEKRKLFGFETTMGMYIYLYLSLYIIYVSINIYLYSQFKLTSYNPFVFTLPSFYSSIHL